MLGARAIPLSAAEPTYPRLPIIVELRSIGWTEPTAELERTPLFWAICLVGPAEETTEATPGAGCWRVRSFMVIPDLSMTAKPPVDS